MTSRDPRLDVAIKYHLAGLDGEATALISEIVAEPEASAAAFEFAATLRQAGGDFPAALAFADRAIAAEPARASAHLVRGVALEAIGQLVNAEIAYRAAIARQQVYPVAWNNLGNVLDAQGRATDAVVAFETAIAQQADYDEAHNNLGATLAGQGRFAAAAQCYARALDANPNNRAADINLAVADVERGHGVDGHRRLATLLRRHPQDREIADNALFSLHNFSADPAELDFWHRTWGATQAEAARPAIAASAERPIRVGYVSADFRRHSVAFFIEPLLRHHDVTAVDVFAYANVVAPDEVTRGLRMYVNNWRSIVGLNTAQVCDLVRADKIDILVDLSGHTQGNRLDVFAARPAPVQLTGIGYPGSTGLNVFDGRLCDGITDPVGEADRFSTEPPLRLPAFHCYQPPVAAPPCLSTSGDGIVFGSFNKLAKLSDATVTLWARVLHGVPTAKLKLKTKPLTEGETCTEVAARFAAAGIAPDRLILSGWVAEDRGHLAAYGDIDIALDPFPYNGTTTTCEALWMGVPVISRTGRTHAARVGASLLASIGRPDWAAADDDAFVAKAVALANDRDGLRRLRATLRDQTAGSRLCDGPRYARGLEAAYRALMRRA